MPHDIAPFEAPYGGDDATIVRSLLTIVALTGEQKSRIEAEALRLISAIRQTASGLGTLEDLLREYALSTTEGLALMMLAEGLLRVPDAETADRFIADKLSHGQFILDERKSDVPLVRTSAWALAAAANVIRPHEDASGVLAHLTKRLGAPVIRVAVRQAVRLMGNHFVMGETIEAALDRAASRQNPSEFFSFDMLGEGARTQADADRYFNAYEKAIESIGRRGGIQSIRVRPGISVKLSALHPKFEAISAGRLASELVPRVVQLAQRAKTYGLNFTIDAEEADRLEISLDIMAQAFRSNSLAEWNGFGLAIQAYQKRALAVIDYVAQMARDLDRSMMVRLVKGAYWDTEIKRAQERGLADYPVFTRKAVTDLNYVACAQRLLDLRPLIFPQFATHNAMTVATVMEVAGGTSGYEFQQLHGMGEALYANLMQRHPELGVRTYAPVGTHNDLLAYLVRRLLENGANTSFVAAVGNQGISVTELLKQPSDILADQFAGRNPSIPLPENLFEDRRNSPGIEFGDRRALALMADGVARSFRPVRAMSVVNGEQKAGPPRQIANPANGEIVGEAQDASFDVADMAMRSAQDGFAAWGLTDGNSRASILDAAADILLAQQHRLIGLLQREGGKTLEDSVSELREAVDFCRYYAAESRKMFGEGRSLPGPTGESNTLMLRPRGVFVSISPWNFPLAIFTGQIAAALAAGNCVVAKPAEQTPLISTVVIELLHEAGVPVAALQLVLGDGEIGARLVGNPLVAGVVFTGSTQVAVSINRALAAKEGPIVPLIAETGGINAMIVDATALAEQVVDDVVTSAFRSAGQRCSALRVLFLQDTVADKITDMIVGNVRELKVGDPTDTSVHIGPVIDAEAKTNLGGYIKRGKTIYKTRFAGEAPSTGNFIGPHIFELPAIEMPAEEIFGPVLHLVRYHEDQIEQVLETIEASGYGLTLGVHSRNR